jgi:hypothetical protein
MIVSSAQHGLAVAAMPSWRSRWLFDQHTR